MPEYMEENLATKYVGDEIHPGETVEEKISLSERFGLWVSFYPFSQDEYLDIVTHWLAHFGCNERNATAAHEEALQWALQRGSRSGRVAFQFARDWAGRHAAQSASTKRGTRIGEGVPHYAHPVVRTHPVTGKQALFVNRGFTLRIPQLKKHESDALLDELFGYLYDEAQIYDHNWRKGDLVIWDNRCTMHRGLPYEDTKYKRELRRVTTLDIPQDYEPYLIAWAKWHFLTDKGDGRLEQGKTWYTLGEQGLTMMVKEQNRKPDEDLMMVPGQFRYGNMNDSTTRMIPWEYGY